MPVVIPALNTAATLWAEAENNPDRRPRAETAVVLSPKGEA
jgi:hypothetical protein